MQPILTFSSRAARCFGFLAGLLAAGLPLAPAFAQIPPNLTAVFPARNATRALPAVSPVFGFDRNMSASGATLGSVKVFSQQRGGRMQNGAGGTTTLATTTSGGGGGGFQRGVVGAGSTTTPPGGGAPTFVVVDPGDGGGGGGGGGGTPTSATSTLTFNPTTDFRPGETIFTTVTTQALSGGNTLTGGAVPLARPWVQQFTVAAGVGPGTFFPGSDPGAGANPRGVAVGDVDGDGDLDLVTANTGASTVSVRLNDGSGAFGGGSEPAVGANPGSVALGDVDGDGDLDLLSATNTISGTASVRFNNGSGTFGGGSDFGVGAFPSSVTVADVDGDGDLDLLTANTNSSTVSVRLNNGSGTFGGGSDPAVGVGANYGPSSVAVGDVDGDGDLDLLTANFLMNTVSVLFGGGSGGFSASPFYINVGAGPSSVALGDVDGDGDLDFVTANRTAGTVSVRLNNGTGNTGAGAFSGGSDFSVGANPRSVKLGDVDGDGDLDLLTANSGASTVSVRLNRGGAQGGTAGTFSGGSDSVVGAGPYSVALGDMDGDGDLDLATANADASTVSVRLNKIPLVVTALSPTRNQRNAPRAASVAVSFDRPLSTGAATTGAVSVFSQQRGGRMSGAQGGAASVSGNTLTFNPATDFQPGETVLTTVTTAARSSSGDGPAAGHVHGFTAAAGVGPGTFNGGSDPSVAIPPFSVAPYSVAAGDVDGDGDLDLLAANTGAAAVSVLLNDGSGTYSRGANVGVQARPSSVKLGDVDGDGDLDLLTANFNASTVSVRLNDGSGAFGGGSNVGVGTGVLGGSSPTSVALGDVDGDGDLDFVTANYTTLGTVSVRLNNGDGTFGGGSNLSVGSFPTSVAVGDVNGDGHLDLLAANSGAGTVSVRFGDGYYGTFSGGSEVGVGAGPESVALGDVDGDGDLDLLTANFTASTVSVRLNNGAGAFGGGSTLNVGANPRSVAAGDVDGDGDLDLLSANNGAASVSVRLNQVPATLALTSLSPNRGVAGTSVTLTGTNFAGATGISFNGTAATTFAVTSATTATATVPAGAATGNVTLTTPAGTSNGVVFTVCAPQALAQDATVPLDANGTVSITAATVNNGSTANCGFAAGGGLSVSPSAFTCANLVGPNTVTLTVTDAGGNISTATATVTITAPPVATLGSLSPAAAAAGATVTVSGTNLSGATALTVNGAAAPISNLTASGFSFVVPAGAATTGNVALSLPCGQSLMAAFAVLPTLSSFTPGSGPVGTTLSLSGTNLTGATAVTFAGSGGNVVSTGFAVASATSITGVVVPAGAISGTLTVTTPQGTSAASVQSFTVTPSLSNLVLSAGSLSPVFSGGTTGYALTVPGTTTATTVTPTNAQVPGGGITVNGTPVVSGSASGSIALAVGDNTITVAVQPVGAGAASTYTVVVTRLACVVTALAKPATVQLNASGTATLLPAAVDNGSSSTCGAVTLSVAPSAFTCANRGPNTVTLTVTDAFNNVTTTTATVTVADGVAPSVTAPGAVLRPTDANQCAAAAGSWLGTATAADNCGAVVTSNAPALFPTGITTVTWTATDPAGNTATATQLVTVEDRQHPAFATQPGPRTVNTDAGLCAASLVLVLPTVSDNCAGTTVAGVRRDNLPLTAPFATGTTVITWTATDGAGNRVSYDQPIVVVDNEAPVARTKAATVTLSSLGAATVAAADVDNGSSDNCGIVSRTVSPSAFSCATLGPQTVTLTVTDAQGNRHAAAATVTVVGSLPVPVITVVPATGVFTGGVATNLYLGYGPPSVTLVATGGVAYAWAPAAGLSNPASANPVFAPTAAGTFAYTVTATSASGCTATASVTLTVRDVRCGNRNDKVLVCHNGNALCISRSDVADHLGHGDPLGTCLPAGARPLAAAQATAAQAAAAPRLQAYPNPAHDAVRVRVLNGAPAGSLQLFDALGRLVHTQPVPAPGTEATLPLTGRPAGLYVLRCGAWSQRLTVE